MQIFVVDNNIVQAEELAYLVRAARPDDTVTVMGFPESEEGWQSYPDMLFINASGREKEAITLAGAVREDSARTGVVVVSDDGSCAVDAFRIHAQGYLVRPLTEDMVGSECEYYLGGHCLQADNGDRHDMEIRTFGDLEIFIDGSPAVFKRKKARELVAYLVDKDGSMVDDSDLLRDMWNKDDKATKSYLRILKAEVIRVFSAAGYSDAIVKQRGLIGIRTDKVKCDLFDALKSAPPILNEYRGEYMRQYGWAQRTRENLDRTIRQA